MIPRALNWKIIIVTHGPIVNEYYTNDPLFSNDHFEFFNVSDQLLTHPKFIVTNKSEILDFIHLGKWFAEAEVIYNMYKLNLYKGYDYIGFIHWDHELKSENSLNPHHVTKQIEKLIRSGERFVSFDTYQFKVDFDRNIMMDPDMPNQLHGNGKNCYWEILSDYNEFFRRNVSMDLLMTKTVNLCSAFLMETSIFEELMPFYCSIIESGKLDAFDTDHSNRFHGTMMERYIACFSHEYSLAHMALKHYYNVSSKVEDVLSDSDPEPAPDFKNKNTGLGIMLNRILSFFGFRIVRTTKNDSEDLQ